MRAAVARDGEVSWTGYAIIDEGASSEQQVLIVYCNGRAQSEMREHDSYDRKYLVANMII
jgi:hypothetical protein